MKQVRVEASFGDYWHPRMDGLEERDRYVTDARRIADVATDGIGNGQIYMKQL
jgi:hypothetical protein